MSCCALAAAGEEVAGAACFFLVAELDEGGGRDWLPFELVELEGCLEKKEKRDCCPLGGSFFCELIWM